MVGGVTKATGLFCTVGIEKIVIPHDPIRRTIGHVIKYSERPIPCNLPVAEPHYTTSDRLSLHQLELPVVFASGFSRTGWGKRKLVQAELEHAFDLPSFVSWEGVKDCKIIPLQLFRVILDLVVGSLGPSIQMRGGSRQKPTQSYSSNQVVVDPLPLDVEWLPTLGKWLPGSWTDIEISAKAVKSDNAVIDFYPWNQRIMLVLPCPPATIVSLEALALRRWRCNISSSFLHYLSREHGSNWPERLRLGSTRRWAASELDSAPEAKRRRFHMNLSKTSVNNGGGCVVVEQCVSDFGELERDVIKGRLVLSQVLQSKWWEWTYGSALLFWRWTGLEQRVAAREGMRMFVQSSLPVGRRRMNKVKLSKAIKVMVAEKIEEMCRRFYLESSGHVANLVNYFAVPKGEADIRVVFDGSSCGLNDTLWAPNFFLPSANAAALLLTFQTWMADMDFGEMFHNFPMEERMRRCSGVEVEVQSSSGGRGGSTKIFRWTRLFMGMRPSPYNAVRYYYWGEEFARGDPSDVKNPMGYDQIRLNLPGMSEFDPMLPKVMKWRSKLGVVAGDVVTFVDDVRITGYSKENCRNVHRQFSSRIQYLGMQDAPRKFRPPSQSQAGAWTGTIFKIDLTSISKTVSQEKWDKGKGMVDQLLKTIRAEADGRPHIDRKRLEKETGFLNHLSMTFDVVRPFLKGFYLTLNSWRSKRDAGDWKVSDKRWRRMLFGRFENGEITEGELDSELFGKDNAEAPGWVKGSVSLASDVEALAVIFSPISVPVVSIRSRRIVTVVYGFGDASGTGLGATFTCGSGLNFRIGVWGTREDPESSNWKEFTNVVEALEDEGDEGNLDNAEVFMFTDNSTVEACVSRGSSTSEKLLGLVVRLQALSLRVGIKIHVFHIAGTRMIAQGTDGVSRGFLGQGVMDGEAMSAFVPIHLSAVERSPQNLVPWIREWAGKNAILLKEKGWFDEGHDLEGWVSDPEGFTRPIIANTGKTYIWTPAPMAAEVALAEMRKSRINRRMYLFVLVCALDNESSRGSYEGPQRCTQWEGNCAKCYKKRQWTQAIFCANFGYAVSTLEICQNLWCGSCYTSSSTPDFFMAAGDQPVAEADDEDRILSGWTPRKSDVGRFTSARNGDNLMVPFECDFCVFGKLFDRAPNITNQKDTFAMACIRRIILDAFWSRARSTVDANTAKCREGLALSRSMGMKGAAEEPGPLPKFDHCGYEVAIQIVVSSLGAGRYSKTHKQWDTIRRFRSAYSNQVRAAREANSNPIVLTDAEGKSYQRIGRDACGSFWFQRFTLGCRKRMGQDWRPNQAISVALMHKLLSKTEDRAKGEADQSGRQKWILAGGYFCICFVLSLRSPEGLMADLEGLIKYHVEATEEVVIPLLGRFKGEHHVKQHLIMSCGVTGSGIRVKQWVRRMLAVHRGSNRSTGPVFVNQEGYQSSTSEMNELFLQVLGEIYEEQPTLFGIDVQDVGELPDKFNVFRSFRRGSESRAVAMKVSEADRYVVNRWKRKESAGANRTTHAIDQHYVDITLVKDAFMRYTKAM